MKELEDGSVDLILVDLPYGVTKNKWDVPVPLDEMWEQFKRVRKENGAVILTAVEPFTSILVVSNLEEYRYDWIWEKPLASGFLSVGYRPLRAHENVLVFWKKKPTYNEQLTQGEPYATEARGLGSCYADDKWTTTFSTVNEGTRRARSVIKIANPMFVFAYEYSLLAANQWRLGTCRWAASSHPFMASC